MQRTLFSKSLTHTALDEGVHGGTHRQGEEQRSAAPKPDDIFGHADPTHNGSDQESNGRTNCSDSSSSTKTNAVRNDGVHGRTHRQEEPRRSFAPKPDAILSNVDLTHDGADEGSNGRTKGSTSCSTKTKDSLNDGVHGGSHRQGAHRRCAAPTPDNLFGHARAHPQQKRHRIQVLGPRSGSVGSGWNIWDACRVSHVSGWRILSRTQVLWGNLYPLVKRRRLVTIYISRYR